MRKLVVLTVSIATILFMMSCTKSSTDRAVFSYFKYRGMDERFEKEIDPQKEYFNPILAGFYPDPSICRKGGNYYMVHSSFSYYPGVPILHSTDLVNWTQIGHVLNRPSQLQLDSIRLSGGIYAPAIEYNKYNDTFYMITTCVDGIGNFVVKTKDPMQNNWSDPIPLPNVGGIDPSLFFDEDGKAYIVHNDAPEGTPEWDGHRAIWIHNYDTETDQTFGERKVLLDAGVDRSTKPIWIEGPHIYKINGKYYLMAAEGGTSVNHTEVILSSDNVKGPYIPNKNNPILSQKGLPEPRPDIVTSVGHADLIDTPQGDWYAIFLGCRPYDGNHYNTGRETFLLPVKWENEFPIILDKGLTVPTVVEKENLSPQKNYLTGNFIWRDNFDSQKLADEWQFIRNPIGNWLSYSNNGLEIEPIATSINAKANPAFIGRRQQHLKFEAETELSFIPKSANEMAGLVCYQNEVHNFVLAKTLINNKAHIILDRAQKENKRIAQIEVPAEYESTAIRLKIEGHNDKYSFWVSFDNRDSWISVAENIDAKNLSTESAGGFTGVVIGIYATSGYEADI